MIEPAGIALLEHAAATHDAVFNSEIASDMLNNSGEMEKVYSWLGDAAATMAYLEGKGFKPERAQ